MSSRILPFLAAFLGGATVIVLFRLPLFPAFDLQWDEWTGALCAALAAVATVVALGIYYYRSCVAENMSRAGDDLYYLGFLLTLVSLICALVDLFIVRPDDADIDRRVFELIGSLGIALLSTVAGILGRVILHGRSENQEIPYEHANRMADRHNDAPPSVRDLYQDGGLGLFVRRLRAEIRGATDAFSHYNRMTMYQAEDTKRHADRMVQEFTRQLQTITQDAIVQTEEACRDMSAQAQVASDAFERRLGDATGGLITLTEQMTSLNRSLAELPANVEHTRRSVDSLGGTAEAAASGLDNKVSEVARACETLVHLAREQRVVMERNLELAGVLATLVEQSRSADHSLAEFAARIEQAQRGMDVLGEIAESIRSDLSGNVSEAARACEVLAHSAREQQEIMERNH